MKNILLLVAIFTCNMGYGKISQEYIQQSLYAAATKVGVPIEILSAVCWVESSHTPEAHNMKDGGPDDAAIGMCQVRYTTALWLGLSKNKGCQHNFKTLNRAQLNYYTCPLFGPYTSAYYAAKYLKYQYNRYGDWESAIAAYNTGTKRICTRGWIYWNGKPFRKCKIGGLLNQYYVDLVDKALKEGR